MLMFWCSLSQPKLFQHNLTTSFVQNWSHAFPHVPSTSVALLDSQRTVTWVCVAVLLGTVPLRSRCKGNGHVKAMRLFRGDSANWQPTRLLRVALVIPRAAAHAVALALALAPALAGHSTDDRHHLTKQRRERVDLL